MKKIIYKITKKILDYSPFIISSLILAFEFYPLIVNPLFGGDSGTRLKNAQYIVWDEGGGRYWLPFLQFIVHIFYLFKIEFSLYKLIPFLFSLLFLFSFTKISQRYLKGYRMKSLIMLIVLVSFVTNPTIIWLSSNLYQEIPVMALFYFLLYLLNYQKNEIVLYLVWIAALLTREYFWIYYIILGLINRKKIVSNSITIFKYFALLLIPISWLLYTRQSLVTGFNSSIIPITVPVVLSRVYRLFFIIKNLGLVPSIIAIIMILILLYKDLINKKYKIGLFEKDYLALSFFSFFIIYLYIIVKDPWAATPYNPRMLFPLIITLPLLYLISFKYLSTKPNFIKYFLTALLTLSLLVIIHVPSLNSVKVVRSPFFREINTFLSLTKGTNKKISLKVGVIGLDYWNEYVQLFVGSLLYEKAEYLTESKKIQDYQLLITNTKNTYPGFVQCRVIRLNKKTSFTVLCKI